MIARCALNRMEQAALLLLLFLRSLLQPPLPLSLPISPLPRSVGLALGRAGTNRRTKPLSPAAACLALEQ